MNRPYIFCHMMTSLDGKISGPFMSSENAGKAGQVFYDLAKIHIINIKAGYQDA